jgi:prepilin-type N-terminal cleavage/methylation domain-containing protein
MDIKSNKGISLVEVIVTVAIIGIIMAPISLVFITSYTNFINESDKAAAEQFAREVLYGNGITSYGVIGDLERSDAKASDIILEGGTTTSSSISIPYKYLDEHNNEHAIIKKYSLDSGRNILNYSDVSSSGDYFKGEKSTSGKEVKIIDFVAGIKAKGSEINSIKTNAVIIEVSVTVETGKSGPVRLESSYRINVDN